MLALAFCGVCLVHLVPKCGTSSRAPEVPSGSDAPEQQPPAHCLGVAAHGSAAVRMADYLFCAALLAVVSERTVLHRYGQACRLLRNGEHRERTIEKRCRGLPRDVICEVHAQRFRPRTILIKRIK